MGLSHLNQWLSSRSSVSGHAGFQPSGLGSPLPLHTQVTATIHQDIHNSRLSRLFPQAPPLTLMRGSGVGVAHELERGLLPVSLIRRSKLLTEMLEAPQGPS